MAFPVLHDDCLLSILEHMPSSRDRKAFSQVSRTSWELEACSRTSLTLGPGTTPASLARLLSRFRNLKTLNVNYLGWRPSSGAQLGDEALFMIAALCPRLENLSLAFCGFVSDQGMAALAGCQALRSLRLNFLPRITSQGLLALVEGCPMLESIHLDRCPRVSGSQWLEAIGKRTLEREPCTLAAPSLTMEALATPPLLPLHQSPMPSSTTSSIPSSPSSSAAASPLRLPLGSPLTPPPLDLPPPSPLAACTFALEETSCQQVNTSKPLRSVPVRSVTVTRCPLVQEGDLAWLGKLGWEALEELHFEAEETESSPEEDETLPLARPFEVFAADLDLRRLMVLNLKNCPRIHQEGLGLVLSRLCTQRKKEQGDKGDIPPLWGLQELHLVHCPGLNDADVKLLLSTFAHSLRRLSLSLIKWLGSLPVAPFPAAARERSEMPSPTRGSCEAQTAVQSSSSHQDRQQLPLSRTETAQQQPDQQSSRAVTTASLAHIADHCKGLRELELMCKDEFASSAKLFEGFADSAISGVVAKLPALQELRVGSGLHVTERTLHTLRDQYRAIRFLEV